MNPKVRRPLFWICGSLSVIGLGALLGVAVAGEEQWAKYIAFFLLPISVLAILSNFDDDK